MSPRTWLITGASAKRLLDRGDRVAATARAPERLADLAEQHGDRLWTATLDVTDTTAVRAVVDQAFAD
jgi:NADP-dependent 3-hydroxy acid dehydrogenase YdfG